MTRKIRKLWIKAIKGSSAAYRKLGILFLQGKVCGRDKELAKLCLDKAAEMGDEQGYFLYHTIFSKKKKIIDEQSYRDINEDYQKTKSWKEKKRLRKYLEVGKGKIRRSKYGFLI